VARLDYVSSTDPKTGDVTHVVVSSITHVVLDKTTGEHTVTNTTGKTVAIDKGEWDRVKMA